jgi:hypothetical protein
MSPTPTATVVIAHYDEDLSWVDRLDRAKYEVFIVSKTCAAGVDVHTPLNIGYEASAYLEYIVRRYHDLPVYTVFVHGHESSWHHAGRLDDLINGLDLVRPFASINNVGMKTFRKDGVDAASRFSAELGNWRRMRDTIFADLASEFKDPATFRFSMCAQFYAHRAAIRRRPLQVYRNILDAVYASHFPSKMIACTMEFSWHVLLTGEFDEEAYQASFLDKKCDALDTEPDELKTNGASQEQGHLACQREAVV